MTTSCHRIRSMLDDDEIRGTDSREERARAEHLRACADCREELKGVIAQRATLQGVFLAEDAPPPLSEALVTRYVTAMVRAARGDMDAGLSAGRA